jgi:hypothetical protein
LAPDKIVFSEALKEWDLMIDRAISIRNDPRHGGVCFGALKVGF